MVEIDYYSKYLKYKQKYIELKNLLLGGVPHTKSVLKSPKPGDVPTPKGSASPKVSAASPEGGIAKPKSQTTESTKPPPDLSKPAQFNWNLLTTKKINFKTDFDKIKAELLKLGLDQYVITLDQEFDRLFSKIHTKLEDLHSTVSNIEEKIKKLKTFLKIIDELNKNNLWYICTLFKSKQNNTLLNNFLPNIGILLEELEIFTGIDGNLYYNLKSTYTKLLKLENQNLNKILPLLSTMAGMIPPTELTGMAIGLDLLSSPSTSPSAQDGETILSILPPVSASPTAASPGNTDFTPRLHKFTQIEQNSYLFRGMLKILFNNFDCGMYHQLRDDDNNQLYYNFSISGTQEFHLAFHGWEDDPTERPKSSFGKIHIKFDRLHDPNGGDLAFNIYMNSEEHIKFTRYNRRVSYKQPQIDAIKRMTVYETFIKPILNKFSLFFNHVSVKSALLPLMETRES